ncbi:MAG: chemotaxis protein CheA [Proteobacteria bacterium]|nr:chemotaxis protein CheA [Desulfobulbaceae bacterium]MBU4153186.1 chemotaxis protein CheA [Pseudomonadota bacterium]
MGGSAIAAQLDEMALKIMMVEPGDLSVVGELVVLIEELQEMPGIEGYPGLQRMGQALRDVICKIVMTELPDSAENYERIGQCISMMQEDYRKGGDDAAETGFVAIVKKIELESDEDEGSVSEIISQEGAVLARSTTISAPQGMKILESSPEEAMEFLQDVELLTGFVGETMEHLESIEVNVLELEDNPGDLEIVNKIFRPFHTIKGVAGFLNLKSIQRLAHSTENLLDDVRNGVHVMDAGVIDVVLKVGDFLKTMVDNLRVVLKEGPEQYKKYDISDYVAWVEAVQKGGGASGTAEEVAISVSSAPEVPVQPLVKQDIAPVFVASGGEAELLSAAAVKVVAPPKASVGDSIKVDVEKLDGLVNAVGELVIMQAMVRSNPRLATLSDPKLIKDFSQLSRITSELQKTAMSMRMVPIRQTFQKMIRLVRDLSKKTGKEVNLVMVGEETEIDRNMVDSIYDPLVHMMRNSVDHGVQIPGEREKLGKPRSGTVSLRAYQKGGYMVIEIEDDGQGLNTEKIRRKAIERGLIQEHDNSTAYELNNLIFLPGFSTADKITDVSGRGVGMDVVKKAVEKLRGKVEAISSPGKGSLFVIRLPLTLAIIDGIIVRVGSERYIIPTTAIQESLKPPRENYNTVQGKGETLMVRGAVLPIIRLYHLFNVEPTYTDPWDAIVVVVEYEGRQRAIMVDELLGKQEVVIKNLGGLSDIPGVAGGTILGDGRVGLILDLAGIVQSHSGHAAVEAKG